MKKGSAEVSPATLLEGELEALKGTVRATAEGFAGQLEAGIDRVREAVAGAKGAGAAARVRDLRDMLALVRMLEVKPEKGRRRDLKRLENLVADLGDLVGRWK
jgi:hypothetical protein